MKFPVERPLGTYPGPMRPLRSLVVGLALLALMTACSNTSDSGDQGTASQPTTLTGSSWILNEVSVNGEMTAAVDASASINFDADGKLSGSTGCNRFTGTWSQEGDTLTVQPGATTQMACAPALQAQENALLAGLPMTNTYTIADNNLTLLSDGTPVAVYRAGITDLSGTSWTATGVNNGKEAVVTTSVTATQTLQFAGDGKVTGFGGCTDFQGSYTTEAAGIAITELKPADGCQDDALGAAQQEYLAALGEATNFSIDGNRLDLRNEAGALQVGFTAAS